MEILMQPNPKILAIIGEQPVFANKDYRFMKYCLAEDFSEGKLILNGLTRAAVILTSDEMKEIGNINKYPFLYKNYFLVPDDFDDMKVVDDVREKFKKPIDDLYLNNPRTFTIITTTRCNARCFYCYELLHKNKKHMTEETANKVGDYINTYAPTNMPINYSFFGGEPLFNQKAIDIIIGKRIDLGLPFNSSFTTNGYLFDKQLALKAKNIWNTGSVQITIDGTESVYNKTKNYIYKDGLSPYKKVLNNIAILLNLGISVMIRMNIDIYNSEDLKKLVKELHDRFGNHPSLGMYAWPIFEDETNIKTPEEHELVYVKLRELEETFDKYGYMYGLYPRDNVHYCQCMADDGESVLIGVNGELGTCEHFFDSHFWGHVNNPLEKDFNELNQWREYNPNLDICENCPIYPSCIRPKLCEEMGKCDEHIKEWRIRRHMKGLHMLYNNIKGGNRLPYKLSENVE
jgi:radical SAM protein with 4Fe4S-binding SPASM domain